MKNMPTIANTDEVDEFDDDDICVETPEEKGLPVGWILGGVAVALGAFVMMR